MKGLFSIKRGSRGFTLVELMVVMSIISVLMAVVFPAVTGTRSVSSGTQTAQDAQSVQSGLETYNNKSAKAKQFPDEAVDAATGQYVNEFAAAPQLTLTFKDKTGATTSTVNSAATLTTFKAAYKAIKWDAETDVWQSDGSVATMQFVPGFVLKIPDSYILKGNETKALTANTINEFLWLLRINNSGKDDESRSVEVFRLTGATLAGAALAIGDALTYEQVY